MDGHVLGSLGPPPGPLLREFGLAALMHDIGKVRTPIDILNKPGKLTEDEQAIMREHCYRGYQMLRKIPFLAEAAEIVYSHQEMHDGTGYPRGLKGDEIPIGLFFERTDVPAAHDAEPVLKPGPLVHQEMRITADVAKSFADELM